MTIFLLLVVIVLLIVFNSLRSSQVERLEDKINRLEKMLFEQTKQHSKQVATEIKQSNTILSTKNALPEEQVTKQEVSASTPIKENITPEPVNKEPVVPIEANIPKETPIHIKPIEFKTNKEPELSWYEKFRANNPDLEKFIGENILSKVAIVVLVIGVAFFVKFAIDKNWINEIARVGIGILTGGIVMAFAHRLHKQFKAFSSVLVAGAITIFYFTIGIAFHQYHIFNQTTAFLIMVVITGFSVFISIMYDRVELAALSLIGGFATPMMVSTGQGNYVTLFIYILILDIGMLVLAYIRKWNLINVLAYVFTFIIYIIWLENKVINKPDAAYFGHLVFGGLFYFVFIAMSIIHNIKVNHKFGAIELSILISNTFIFYGFGMQILSYWHPEFKGLFSASLAFINLMLSWLLYKKFKADEKLIYLLIGLTLTFVTLIAPVQLKGNYITIFWALESVLLIWLSQKSGIVLYRFTSVVIVVLMIFSLIIDWSFIYGSYSNQNLRVFLNKAFVTGFMATLSLGFTVWLLKQDKQEDFTYLGITMKPKVYGTILSLLTVIVAYFTGILELGYQLNQTNINASSISISLFSFHFLFFVILQFIAQIKYLEKFSLTFLIINYFNLSIYTIVFILFSMYDFQSYIFNAHYSSLGFWMHYLIILSAIYSIFSIHKVAKGTYFKFSNASMQINTILLSFFIVFLLSSEAIILGIKFNVNQINPELLEDLSNKFNEYYSVKSHIVKIVFPILWGFISFVFLAFGMKRNYRTLRVMSLILIAVTLVKLFTYDIKDASEAGKIIAFIMLGIVLLIISFMYQKIKALIINDSKQND